MLFEALDAACAGADGAVQMAALCSGRPFQTVLDELFLCAAELAAMPDEKACTALMLRRSGFSPHRFGRGAPPDAVFEAEVRARKHSALILQSSDGARSLYSLVQLRSDGFFLLRGTPQAVRCPITQVWTPDPHVRLPRKRTPRPPEDAQETRVFRLCNVNPLNRNTGDCVIRALSVLLEQSWEDTLCELSASGTAEVSRRGVFEAYLRAKGAQMHETPRRNHRLLTAAAFTEVLARRYTHAERICAYVGRGHLTAFVPNGRGYQIVDTWNPETLYVGRYFVYRPAPEAALQHGAHLTRGLQIAHPAFGVGHIVRYHLSAQGPTELIVQFAPGKTTRMPAEWVEGLSPADSLSEDQEV